MKLRNLYFYLLNPITELMHVHIYINIEREIDRHIDTDIDIYRYICMYICACRKREKQDGNQYVTVSNFKFSKRSCWQSIRYTK